MSLMHPLARSVPSSGPGITGAGVTGSAQVVKFLDTHNNAHNGQRNIDVTWTEGWSTLGVALDEVVALGMQRHGHHN